MEDGWGADCGLEDEEGDGEEGEGAEEEFEDPEMSWVRLLIAIVAWIAFLKRRLALNCFSAAIEDSKWMAWSFSRWDIHG